jgi:DNA-binding NtrC family response regulator
VERQAFANTIEHRRSPAGTWTAVERRRARPGSGGREVLLVDDDPGFVETLGALLRNAGLAVIAEFTHADALKYLTSHTPDVLITDLRLGNADGWDLAEYASTHQPRLPVVIVTGWASLADDAKQKTDIPIFVKPFDPDALLSYLEDIFRR